MRPLDGGLGPNPVYSFWHLDASPSFCVVDSRKRPRRTARGPTELLVLPSTQTCAFELTHAACYFCDS